MEEIKVPEVQIWLDNSEDDVLAADPMFAYFKKQELVATLLAAVTGKYNDYWTVDRIADLNNAVDAGVRNNTCPEPLAAIFGSSASKNSRIRANKIGQLVLKHTHGVMQGQQAQQPEPPTMTPAESTLSLSMSLKNQSLTADGQSTFPRVQAVQMQLYQFAPDLPGDCELRVRSTPSMDGETVLCVTRNNEIYVTGMHGDWLAVEIPGSGLTGDAWMMARTDTRTLLMPAAEAPVPLPQEPDAQGPQGGPPTQSVTMVSSGSVRGAPGHPPVSPMRNALVNMSLPTTPMNSSGLLSSLHPLQQEQLPQAAFTPGGSVVPSTVSYTAYQMLEMRVSHLEAELAALKAHLRGC